MNKLIFLKLNIRLIIVLSIFVDIMIASGWIYQADLLNAEIINEQNIKELSGNVFISKDETTLTTKKAILYSDNDQLELFGDIIMISNADTLKCDTLFYYPNNNTEVRSYFNILVDLPFCYCCFEWCYLGLFVL